jgi:hypothetical protein
MDTKIVDDKLIITIPIGKADIAAAKNTSKGDKKLLASAMFMPVAGRPELKLNVSLTAPLPA